MKVLSQEQVNQLLIVEDLTEKENHCISILINEIKNALINQYKIIPSIEKGNKIVNIEDNYDNLGYQRTEITLSEKYTKYVSENMVLRTQMSSTIPLLLREYKKDEDRLYMCPGIVYRRDVRDKTHVGEPHQMDIWLLTRELKKRSDLLSLVKVIISVIKKHTKKEVVWRYNETSHNYTDEGIEVEILHNGKWMEILECGLIGKSLLKRHNLEGYGGLALGMGLERLVMIIKDIDDIRVLKDIRPEVQKQMSNLKKYQKVSKQPSTKRDLSIAVKKDLTEEEMTERILECVSKEDISIVEEIRILNETVYEDLPDVAKQKLGINDMQKNVLLRIILRDLVSSIQSENANALYSAVYDAVHEGTVGYKITDKVSKE